jgi:hypothetical protein
MWKVIHLQHQRIWQSWEYTWLLKSMILSRHLFRQCILYIVYITSLTWILTPIPTLSTKVSLYYSTYTRLEVWFVSLYYSTYTRLVCFPILQYLHKAGGLVCFPILQYLHKAGGLISQFVILTVGLSFPMNSGS